MINSIIDLIAVVAGGLAAAVFVVFFFTAGSILLGQ
jgi:hypothetical protein